MVLMGGGRTTPQTGVTDPSETPDPPGVGAPASAYPGAAPPSPTEAAPPVQPAAAQPATSSAPQAPPVPTSPGAGGPTAPAAVAPRGAARGRRLPTKPLLAVGGVVVVGLGVGAYFLSGGSAPAKHARATTAALPETFHSSADGFSISYPSTWHQVHTPNAPLQLQVGTSTDAMRVQVEHIATAVNTTNVADVKAFTDSLFAGANVKILDEKPILLNGIPGLYYLDLYTSGKEVGSNALYFLFQGRKLSIITFQALPWTDFAGLAPTFDNVANSFRSNPAVLGPLPPTATTAPPSTSTTLKHKTTSTRKG